MSLKSQKYLNYSSQFYSQEKHNLQAEKLIKKSFPEINHYLHCINSFQTKMMTNTFNNLSFFVHIMNLFYFIFLHFINFFYHSTNYTISSYFMTSFYFIFYHLILSNFKNSFLFINSIFTLGEFCKCIEFCNLEIELTFLTT